MNITVLNFSPRENGNCSAICGLIQNHYINSNIRLFHVCKHVSPCNSCDYECLKPGALCPQLTRDFTDMMDSICGSDLVYYVIPNFCGMPNAVYYAFNERTVGYFNMDRTVMGQYMNIKKRFIVVSNTETELFQESLRQQTTEQPVILYLKTSHYKRKSIAGDMMEAPEAQEDLLRFLRKETDT